LIGISKENEIIIEELEDEEIFLFLLEEAEEEL